MEVMATIDDDEHPAAYRAFFLPVYICCVVLRRAALLDPRPHNHALIPQWPPYSHHVVTPCTPYPTWIINMFCQPAACSTTWTLWRTG